MHGCWEKSDNKESFYAKEDGQSFSITVHFIDGEKRERNGQQVCFLVSEASKTLHPTLPISLILLATCEKPTSFQTFTFKLTVTNPVTSR